MYYLDSDFLQLYVKSIEVSSMELLQPTLCYKSDQMSLVWFLWQWICVCCCMGQCYSRQCLNA